MPKSADWNASFVLWCYEYNNNDRPNKLQNVRAFTDSSLFNSLKSKGYAFDYPTKKNFRRDRPKAGDIVFLDFEDKVAEQCGIVYNIDKDFVYTIEGNINGKVQKKVRYLNDVLAFARIP